MDRIRIRGGRPLAGEIQIGGAKNAALPLMAAGLLTEERVILSNVPKLADIDTMTPAAGPAWAGGRTRCGNDGRTLSIGGPITNTEAPYDIVRKMRASFLVLGPLLARVGEARVSLPGGCSIGARPIDLHLKGLEQLGATFDLDGGYIDGRVAGRLRGATIVFPFVSVGATEQLLMAASLADGRTVLANAAREPEITDLADCLVRDGRAHRGHRHRQAGRRRRRRGCTARRTPSFRTGSRPAATPVPRRSPAGRCSCAHARLEHLGATVRTLREAGVEMPEQPGGLMVKRLNGLHGADVMTEPYPGFPTDMQAQFMALMSVAEGASMVTETIFENRFMHVPELNRMGARINVHGASAIVRGVPSLSGAPVMATDLRASLSLMLAGLAAKGETVVNRVYHLDRGYEAVERKLAACGADIERIGG